MVTYCTVADVYEQIQMDSDVMTKEEVEKRITQAETWVNATQDATYSAPISDLIKYATACYAGSLILSYLFTTQEPNQSNQAKELIKKAENYLHIYNTSTQTEESGVGKINQEYFNES